MTGYAKWVAYLRHRKDLRNSSEEQLERLVAEWQKKPGLIKAGYILINADLKYLAATDLLKERTLQG